MRSSPGLNIMPLAHFGYNMAVSQYAQVPGAG
jgi:hypothetical protein